MNPADDTNRTAALVKWILIVFFAAIAIWAVATFFMNGEGAGAGGGAAAIYQCPMHHEIVSDTPGRCQICGMDLAGGSPGKSDAGMHTGGSTAGHGH